MTILKYIGVGIAGVVVGALLFFFFAPKQPEQAVGGVYNNVTNSFPAGVVQGDRAVFFKSGTIDAGSNQTAYTNTTGRTLFIAASDVQMGWNSGVASSSFVGYVSTSSGTTVTNYSRPTGAYLLIDGAVWATSTPTTTISTGTSTSAGAGAIALANGDSVIFNVQPRDTPGCAGTGKCEAATSTNRGIASFFWNFKATYLP